MKPQSKIIIFSSLSVAISGVVILLYLFVKNHEVSTKNHIDYFEKFDLKFSGQIFEIEELQHDRAQCKIKINKANKAEYNDNGTLGYVYCILKNDTAIMELPNAGSLRIGDSIFIGPHRKYVVKAGIDTIINLPDGGDFGEENGRRR